jgi:hypothetical protein
VFGLIPVRAACRLTPYPSLDTLSIPSKLAILDFSSFFLLLGTDQDSLRCECDDYGYVAIFDQWRLR